MYNDILSISSFGYLTDLDDYNLISLIGTYGFFNFDLESLLTTKIINLESGFYNSHNMTSSLAIYNNLVSNSNREFNFNSGV